MKYTPKMEAEIGGGFEPLPEGEYPFTVMESNIVQSKSEKNFGREQVKLKINVHGSRDKHVYDYFADWFSEWKFKHFHETVGLKAEYESGEVDPSNNAYKNRTGYVKIVIEKNGKTGEYENRARDYIVKEVKTQPVKAEKAKAVEQSDDVPF